MKILSLIFSASILLLFSCGEPEAPTSVSGSLKNNQGTYMYLSERQNTDSVKIESDGSFYFPLQTTEPTFMRLFGKDKKSYVFLLVNPNDKISIEADANDLSNTSVISGSEESKRLQDLNDQYLKGLDKIKVLQKDYNQMAQNPAMTPPKMDSIVKNLQVSYKQIADEMAEMIKTFIDENQSSLISVSASYLSIDSQSGKPMLLAQSDTNITYYQKIDSVLLNKYPDSQITKDFHRMVNDISESIKKRNEEKQRRLDAQLKIGSEVPEIALPLPNNEIAKLSSLRGKYVLLDFWASWCKPCRMESPNLVKAYTKYNTKGFEIYQVSLDNNKDNWLKAVQQDNLFWKNHVSDLLMWKSPLCQEFGIFQIPMNYLIDKDGLVIAQNLRGEALDEKLEEIFNK